MPSEEIAVYIPLIVGLAPGLVYWIANRYEEQKIDVVTSLHSFSYFISKRKLVKPSSPRCLDYDIQYMINHF